MSTKKDLLRTSKQIAHELGVTPRTVMRWKAEGRLSVHKGCSGGRTSRYEIDREDLARFNRKR